MEHDKPIGIFDSGVGGLSVVKNIIKVLPNENFIYIADSKHFPYGTKSAGEVRNFALRIIKYLLAQNVKAVIVACNTASSVAINEIKKSASPIPVFGMIQAGAQYAAKTTKNHKICVISTPLTQKKHTYLNEIKNINPSTEVFEVGSQEMVNLVENGIEHNEFAVNLTKENLKEPIEKGVDTIVLGSTHLPFLYRTVKSVAGESISVIDPSDFLIIQVKEFLNNNDLLNRKHLSERFFFTTGNREEFKEKMKVFLEGTYIPERLDI